MAPESNDAFPTKILYPNTQDRNIIILKNGGWE